MSKIMDLTNQRYGRLVVLEYVGRNTSNRPLWKCQCDCGNTHIASTLDLRNGDTQSCGCQKKEKISKSKRKHGFSSEPLYKKWKSMRRRCNNSNDTMYRYYGGRGIKVCKEWDNLNDGYLNFRNWALNSGYSPDLTLDRIDNNGNYEPFNCRWANMTIQSRNRNFTRKVYYRGEKIHIYSLADKYNLSHKGLYYRIKEKGMTPESAVYDMLCQ